MLMPVKLQYEPEIIMESFIYLFDAEMMASELIKVEPYKMQYRFTE